MDSPANTGLEVPKRKPGRPLGSKGRKAVAKPEADVAVVQPMPSWIVASLRDPADSAFACGAALTAFDAVLRAHAPWSGALRMRQALKSAVVLSRMLRLNADDTALRDALHLTRAKDDPGPAGRLHRLLRQLTARPSRFAEETLEAIVAELGNNAIAGEILPLLRADFALAKRLDWDQPVLLHITSVTEPALRQGEAGRRPRADAEDWPDLQNAVLAHALMAAHADAVGLHRRATKLAAAADTLRTREGANGLALLMADESVAPWHMVGKASAGKGRALAGLGSDRAARRFCETLAGLGALRLLTDRPTFRLYGL
ncbi:MAG: DUF1403 family protein [Beijerinckiaceae bacterium]